MGAVSTFSMHVRSTQRHTQKSSMLAERNRTAGNKKPRKTLILRGFSGLLQPAPEQPLVPGEDLNL
jgi:hypothetical protein